MNIVPSWIPVTCENCRHYNGDRLPTCAAYPQGIPFAIFSQANSHLVPQPGDHGILFEPNEQMIEMLRQAGIQETEMPEPERIAA